MDLSTLVRIDEVSHCRNLGIILISVEMYELQSPHLRVIVRLRFLTVERIDLTSC